MMDRISPSIPRPDAKKAIVQPRRAGLLKVEKTPFSVASGTEGGSASSDSDIVSSSLMSWLVILFRPNILLHVTHSKTVSMVFCEPRQAFPWKPMGYAWKKTHSKTGRSFALRQNPGGGCAWFPENTRSGHHVTPDGPAAAWENVPSPFHPDRPETRRAAVPVTGKRTPPGVRSPEFWRSRKLHDGENGREIRIPCGDLRPSANSPPRPLPFLLFPAKCPAQPRSRA